MNLCSRCHKNPAVVYITKMEGDKTINEGLCIACAKELGIAPINDMIEKMGITDEDLENMNSEMANFMNSMEEVFCSYLEIFILNEKIASFMLFNASLLSAITKKILLNDH